MSEIMHCYSYDYLLDQATRQFDRERSIFGIREEKFFRSSGPGTEIFGKHIATPIGPAAGPHTQLAQNIVSAYLAGARFFELKTVQIMDGEELRNCVPRPCINARDEGYNVEWSTELTTAEAFGEYVNAWNLIQELGARHNLDRDVIFNMSVGYSYEGITSEKIDGFIEGLKEKGISNSVTLSTLHGCPPEEIEKIATYLLREKKLHTLVKCNPTLLGYQSARRILDEAGYGYVAFDAHHFEEDLQFADAVAMIGRLQQVAAEEGLSFGVKITNTFPVDIKHGELPGEEMYMSGRALFPLSMTVAGRLSEALDSNLAISYSGGADAFNLARILACGIRPVTFATTLLKPGGYERFAQLAAITDEALGKLAQSGAADSIPQAQRISLLAQEAPSLPRHRKEYREVASRKTTRPLPLFDCAAAPCSHAGCAINQRIPDYLFSVSTGNYAEAFAVIARDNVLPSVTGNICDHRCQAKCTRIDYDDSLKIRQAKKLAADAAQQAFNEGITPPPLATEKKALVIGAGPAGLAAAIYLRRNGMAVDVREKREKAMGIVSYVIPAFRIPEEAIARDAAAAERYGVNITYGAPADYDLAQLKTSYDYILLATGAWEKGAGPLPVDDKCVLDALPFLEQSKASGLTLSIGSRVAVIGAGDVAMDCARAAKKNAGAPEVTIVYRRTRDFMPAQREEIELALAEGVQIRELLSPVAFADGQLTCENMQLGDWDESGRRAAVPGEGREVLAFDTVISAVGARVDTSQFAAGGILLDEKGVPALSERHETNIAGVYIIGDCKEKPATVVRAMADAKNAARDILEKCGITPDFAQPEEPLPVEAYREARTHLLGKKGVLLPASEDAEDAARCLSCAMVCEICVDVCPNRANVAVDVTDAPAGLFGQPVQILHYDAACNECGNCATFCPLDGAPYKDKLTVFESAADFANSENPGFAVGGPSRGVSAEVLAYFLGKL